MALVAGPAAAEAVADIQGVRTHLMWYPSDRLWAGTLPTQGCGPRLIEPTGDLNLAAPIRRATYERRGELIAELRAPRRITRAVLTKARVCAAEAASATTLPALLTPAPEPFDAFNLALATCLKSSGAARHVGSMTLWIDTSCNW